MNRINEYAGRQLALMSALNLLEKNNINMRDLESSILIDQALNFDICKDLENFENHKNIDLLKNLSLTWLSIYDYKSPAKIWASDVLAAYQRGRRDIFVHDFLKKTNFKYNEIGFFEDEFQEAAEGRRMLSEDKYRALEIIFNFEKNRNSNVKDDFENSNNRQFLLDKNKILALYRVLMKYANYKDLKTLSCRWLCNCSMFDIFANKIDLNNIEWEYKPPIENNK